MKTMTINCVKYVEVPARPTTIHMVSSHCRFCALEKSLKKCAKAVDGAAEKAFGGDCIARGVYYMRADI